MTGLAMGSASVVDGWLRWPLAIFVPTVAAVIWGTFNVPGDPSRSGRAPVVVPGRTRLILELGVLAAGWLGFAIAGRAGLAAPLVMLTGLHYATTEPRIRWLLER